MPNTLRHGFSGERVYRIWRSMKSRCLDPNHPPYKDYGGRGITVCDDWLDSVKFIDWAMANGYTDYLQLDREDNDLGYSPENCRWVTPGVNARNRRDNVYLHAFGESKLLLDWFEDERCNVGSIITLRGRLRRGWHAERAISAPSRRCG